MPETVQRLAQEVSELTDAVEAHRVQMHRSLSWRTWVAVWSFVVTFGLVIAMGYVVFELRDQQAEIRDRTALAIDESCEGRKQLEGNLVKLLEASRDVRLAGESDDQWAARRERLNRAIAAVPTPPCEATNPLRR